MSTFKKIIIFLSDIVALYLSLIIALLIRYQNNFFDTWKVHIGPFSIIFIIWILVFYISDLYRYQMLRGTADLLKKIFGAVVVSGMISMGFFYIFFSFFELTPKTNLIIFSGIFFVLSASIRFIIFKAFSSGAIKITIIGNSPLLKETVYYIKNNPQAGYTIANWIENTEENISEIISSKKIELLVIQEEYIKNVNIFPILYELLSANTNFINFLDFFESIFEKVPIKEIEKYWLIENIPSKLPSYEIIQRMFDIVLVILISIILLPIGIIISFLIMITSGFPIIYSQIRIGKNDSLFTIYKFRTMNKNAEKNGPLYAQINDPRLTRFGKILRHMHLDEIPQLINILKSEISFVGPRPERPNFVKQFKNTIPYYNIRHLVKPGLTGWAQINYRYTNESVDDTKEKLSYDMYYIKHRSIILNILIILKTLKRLFINAK